jgi:hypothetical protein
MAFSIQKQKHMDLILHQYYHILLSYNHWDMIIVDLYLRTNYVYLTMCKIVNIRFEKDCNQYFRFYLQNKNTV